MARRDRLEAHIAAALPEGDIPAPAGAGVSKSAVSRRFVALSAAQMKQWMATELSKLDLLVIQIDGVHIENDLVLLAAVGIDGVVRLKLPLQLRRSLACTNIIENMMGSVRRVCRNVKRWRDAPMALRWTGAAMQEAAKGFRRLKAHKQLPVLRKALAALGEQNVIDTVLAPDAVAA
jgi:hypothetical protein